MTSETNSLKSFFASIQVPVSDVWLESCKNWCKTETLGPNYTLEELQRKVYEQWLFCDLRDVGVAVLPPDIFTKKHFTLTGSFCLQMMQIVDISKPKLWQIQKIRNSNALTRGTQKDSDVVGTGKRLLQMTLTDGVQEVQAMEYRPITCLSINLAPGIKVRILGSVVVRRGRLMLEQRNVKILGGEVEDLLICNAAENVLARSLNLPENPNPGVIQEKLLDVEKEDKFEGYVNKVSVPKPPPAQIIEDELMDEEIDRLLEAEAELKNPQINQNESFNMPEEVTENTNSNKPVEKRPPLSFDDDDIFDDIDLDAHLDKFENQLMAGPGVISIVKLLENKSKVSKGVFKIRAKFKGIEEKLRFADGEYALTIKIEDSTGELVVRIHSNIIAEFAECPPADIISLQSNVLNKDEAALDTMMKAIIKVKNRLLVLNNEMMVQVEKDTVPIVTKIF